MIDHSLVISPESALIFHLKQGFFLYVWPMMIGFVTILGYQTLGRVGMMGNRQVAGDFRAGEPGFHDVAVRLDDDGAGHPDDPVLRVRIWLGLGDDVAGLRDPCARSSAAEGAHTASDLARGQARHREVTASAAG